MPLHDFECPAGHRFEAVIAAGTEYIPCQRCANNAQKVFLRAPMGFVQADICYDSPVDGRPITSKHARLEDLKQNGCEEYDPGMRQDMERRRADRERALDKKIDASVDEFVATAGARKVEKLEQELRAGVGLGVERGTPN